jgi:hypothetical protein
MRVCILLIFATLFSLSHAHAQCTVATNLYFDRVSSRGAYLYCTQSNTSGATYQARWRAVGSVEWVEGAVFRAPAMIARGLQNNTTYEWQVRIICNTIPTAYSANGPNFTTRCRAPSSGGNFGIDDDSAYLWWETLLDEQFNLYYREAGVTAWSSVTGLTGDSYTIRGLKNLTTYQYFLRTFCSDGNESLNSSPTFTFTTLSQCDMFEPNNSPQVATRVRGTFFLSDRLCIKPLGDQDWFYWRYSGYEYYIQVTAHRDKPTGQYKFYLTYNGATLTVATQAYDDGSSDLDTYLRLYAADGITLLAQNDNSGGRLVSQINYTLPILPPCTSQVTQYDGLWFDDDLWSCGRRPNAADNPEITKEVTLQSNQIGWTKRIRFSEAGKLILRPNAVIYLGR